MTSKQIGFGGARMAAVAGAVALLFASATASAQEAKDSYTEFEQMELLPFVPSDLGGAGRLPVLSSPSGPYKLGFEAVTQYDAAAFSRNFIPPDTMGAVGATQFMATANGVYGIFDKTTGAVLSKMSDVTFWSKAGQTGANGDSRVLYNADAGRWIVLSFGSNVKDIQVAVSNNSDAVNGGWKSVKYQGYGGFGFGATADYPTLAMDKNAVYIGTNNFAPASSGGSNSFRGVSLAVIPLDSLFGATPSVANGVIYNTPYVSGGSSNADRGFAIQGVNSKAAGSTGKIVANSLFDPDHLAYTVNGLTSSSALGSSLSGNTFLGVTPLANAGPARQPSAAISANRRVIDALDQRISSSAFEVGGRIYMVNTAQCTCFDPSSGSGDYARVRYTVIDSSTFAVLSQGEWGYGNYDFFQGSLAVNDAGKVVLGYNRSGLDPATGKVTFMAQVFNTAGDGSLVPEGSEMVLKESLTDDYHNGSTFGNAAAGRQRWGDYSQVTIDPSNQNQFYAIGEFAREYNNAAGGHPGGTGGSRWGTWVALIDTSEVATPVPEPSTWLMLLGGLGAVGNLARRRRTA